MAAARLPTPVYVQTALDKQSVASWFLWFRIFQSNIQLVLISFLHSLKRIHGDGIFECEEATRSANLHAADESANRDFAVVGSHLFSRFRPHPPVCTHRTAPLRWIQYPLLLLHPFMTITLASIRRGQDSLNSDVPLLYSHWLRLVWIRRLTSWNRDFALLLSPQRTMNSGCRGIDCAPIQTQ
jgi:hypothetical protein